METRVLDTDVFSFFFKRDSRSGLYEPEVEGQQLCLCFQTVAEVKAWAIERNWGKARRDSLEQMLQHYVILPYDTRMADAWAEDQCRAQEARQTDRLRRLLDRRRGSTSQHHPRDTQRRRF